MNRRRVCSLLVVVGVALLTLVSASALSSPRPDHDAELAADLYGDEPECPSGDIVIKSEWEQKVARLEEIQERAPEGVTGLGLDSPPIDVLWIEPDVSKVDVPAGATHLVPCVLVETDRMVQIMSPGIFVNSDSVVTEPEL